MSPKSRRASRSSASSHRVRWFRRDPAVRVLGPGLRAVLWVQGCTLSCPGCLVPGSWPAEGQRESSPAELARWVLSCGDIEGLTLSGGEPMQQALPLATLVDALRGKRDLGVVCYTGYRLEELRGAAQRDLLARVDLLIDGRYREDLHADLLWRGSSNQRLHLLTDRYRPLCERWPDRGAGLELRFQKDGRYTFSGVPPWPGYVEGLGLT